MNRRITNDDILTIALMAVLFIIPQILFLGFATRIPYSMVVYCFMTAFTLLHLILCFLVVRRRGMRVAASVIHLSSIFTMLELIACAVLLLMRVMPKFSVIILTLLGLIHFLFIGILFMALEK